jgi:hypothetical protein
VLDNDSTVRGRFIRLFPFYYGWIILIVGSIGVLASIPGQTMGVSVFTDHFIEHLQLSRVRISTAYMIGTLTSSLVIPRAGVFYDRMGARLTASIAAISLALFLLGSNWIFWNKIFRARNYYHRFTWYGCAMVQ